MDNNRTVLVAVARPVSIVNGSEAVNLSDTTITPTVQKMKAGIVLDVNFKYKNEVNITKYSV